MNIGVIGLGYVGTVSAICFASLNQKFLDMMYLLKNTLLSKGKMPFYEPQCTELLYEIISNNNFAITKDLKSLLRKSEFLFICVGTPSDSEGNVELKYLCGVIDEISSFLQKSDKWLGICIRSTIPPGTIENIIIPRLETKTNKKCGVDFGVLFCPEFLREGSAISDFFNPPYIVTSSSDDKMKAQLIELWEHLSARSDHLHVSFKVAEMCKYTSNAFHALKIAFANEIGYLSESVGANGKEVMELLVKDKILNISEKYLKPGFAFGGSCLPKDLRALEMMALEKNLKIPLLKSILGSNNQLLNNVSNYILKKEYNLIGFAGITFKDGTDDLRESAVVSLIDLISEKISKIYIYDEKIIPNTLTGVNKKIWDKLLIKQNISFIKDMDTFIKK